MRKIEINNKKLDENEIRISEVFLDYLSRGIKKEDYAIKKMGTVTPENIRHIQSALILGSKRSF